MNVCVCAYVLMHACVSACMFLHECECVLSPRNEDGYVMTTLVSETYSGGVRSP